MAPPASAESERDRSVLVDILAAGGARAPGAAADALIEALGSLPAILAAAPEALGRITGDASSATVLVAARRLLKRALMRRACEQPLLPSSAEVADYLHVAMAYRPREEVRALFLDAGNRLLREERLGLGTVDEVPVYKREIVRRALDLNASGLILAHNHPSGSLEPSATDLRITRELAVALRQVNVALLDHLIISRAGWRSIHHEG